MMSNDSSPETFRKCAKKRSKKTRNVGNKNKNETRKAVKKLQQLDGLNVSSKKICKGRMTVNSTRQDGLFLKGVRSLFMERPLLTDENVARRNEDLCRLIDCGFPKSRGVKPYNGDVLETLGLDTTHREQDVLRHDQPSHDESKNKRFKPLELHTKCPKRPEVSRHSNRHSDEKGKKQRNTTKHYHSRHEPRPESSEELHQYVSRRRRQTERHDEGASRRQPNSSLQHESRVSRNEQQPGSSSEMHQRGSRKDDLPEISLERRHRVSGELVGSPSGRDHRGSRRGELPEIPLQRRHRVSGELVGSPSGRHHRGSRRGEQPEISLQRHHRVSRYQEQTLPKQSQKRHHQDGGQENIHKFCSSLHVDPRYLSSEEHDLLKSHSEGHHSNSKHEHRCSERCKRPRRYHPLQILQNNSQSNDYQSFPPGNTCERHSESNSCEMLQQHRRECGSGSQNRYRSLSINNQRNEDGHHSRDSFNSRKMNPRPGTSKNLSPAEERYHETPLQHLRFSSPLSEMVPREAMREARSFAASPVQAPSSHVIAPSPSPRSSISPPNYLPPTQVNYMSTLRCSSEDDPLHLIISSSSEIEPSPIKTIPHRTIQRFVPNSHSTPMPEEHRRPQLLPVQEDRYLDFQEILEAFFSEFSEILCSEMKIEVDDRRLLCNYYMKQMRLTQESSSS